jgi:hypothetical protein
VKTLSRFVTEFTSLIAGMLSSIDRVIFKGYLPITNGRVLAHEPSRSGGPALGCRWSSSGAISSL